MSALVLVEAITQPDRTQEAIRFLAGKFPETRQHEGCESLTTHLGEDGKTIVVVQYWASKDHFDTYFAWRQETGSFDEFVSMLEEPPEIRAFEPVDA